MHDLPASRRRACPLVKFGRVGGNEPDAFAHGWQQEQGGRLQDQVQ
jgi:hypothetical protein